MFPSEYPIKVPGTQTDFLVCPATSDVPRSMHEEADEVEPYNASDCCRIGKLLDEGAAKDDRHTRANGNVKS